MRWDAVIKAVSDAAIADPTLFSIFGSAGIRAAGDAAPQAKALLFRLIADTETEIEEPSTVQWEIWTTSVAELVTAERALRALFVKPIPVVIEGVYMFSSYIDGGELGTASTGPDRMNLYGRATRFRFSPIRESLRAGRS